MTTQEVEWADQMRAAIEGDGSAYKAVLQSLSVFLRGEVRRGLTRYGYGQSDVEDIVQEALLAIHLKRGTWRTHEPIIPWVRAIARNKVIDSLRKLGRRINVPIDDVVETLAAPVASEHLTPDDGEKILSQLQGRQRDVVRSISMEGISIRETAAKFTMTEGAVRVALHRGLTQLSKIYRTPDL